MSANIEYVRTIIDGKVLHVYKDSGRYYWRSHSDKPIEINEGAAVFMYQLYLAGKFDKALEIKKTIGL